MGKDRSRPAHYRLFAVRLGGKEGFSPQKGKPVWLFICGFLSGVLGGAYGINGPPLAVYGNIRKWDAKIFRATLQGYFLPASLAGLIGYMFQGLISREVSMPTVFPAIFLGRVLNGRLKGQHFFKYIYVGMLLIGIW